MNLDLTEEQSLILAALDRIAKPFEQEVLPARVWLDGTAMAEQVAAAGFLELALREEDGLLAAVLLVERISRLPHTVEIGGSGLIAPALLGRVLTGGVAVAAGQAGRPVRFLDRVETLLLDDGEQVRLIPTQSLKIEQRETIFGYPLGIAASYDAVSGETIDIPVGRFRALRQLALSAEIAGAAAAALERTVQYVKDRRQFGRPLGAFQAIQHRLAESAVAVRSMYLLCCKAAVSRDPADAAMAVVFAQRQSSRICYDLHQFHGAIGLTMEYPLHFWTHRLRALEGEMGGANANACSVELAGTTSQWADFFPV